jgi:hypothetical protein
MIAIRRVQDVIAGAVTIRLPAHSSAKRVEVIILPVDEDEQETGQLQRLLQTAPTMSDDDLREFDQVRKWMNQWTFERVDALTVLDPTTV